MEQASELSGLFTARQVCDRWGIDRSTLTRWLQSGYIPGTRERFPFMRVGKKLMFNEEQIVHIEDRMCRTSRQRKRAS